MTLRAAWQSSLDLFCVVVPMSLAAVAELGPWDVHHIPWREVLLLILYALFWNLWREIKKKVTTDHRTFEEEIIYDFYHAVRYDRSPSLKLGLFGRKDGYVYVVTLKCDQTAFCHIGFFDVVSRLFWCGLPSKALQERSVRSRTLPHMFIISPLFYWWPQNLRKRKRKTEK